MHIAVIEWQRIGLSPRFSRHGSISSLHPRREATSPDLESPILSLPTMLLFRWFSSLLTHLVLIIPTIASLVNRTIDDEFGDSVTGVVPTYAPQGWLQGQNCTGCSFNSRNVDISQVFNGSWHSAMHIPGSTDFNVTASFSGIAVYVFNLIALQASTNLTFYLDGEAADTFHPTQPDGVVGIQYRVPVFSKTGLSNGPHTLEIVSGGPTHSLVLFDYIEYTVDEDSKPSSTNTSSLSSGHYTPTSSMHVAPSTQDSRTPVATTRLGGAVGGGVAAIVSILAITAYLIRHRRRAQLHPLHSSVDKLALHEDDGVDGVRKDERTEGARHQYSAPSLSRLPSAPALGECICAVSYDKESCLTLYSVGSSSGRSELDELSMVASPTLRTASQSDCTTVLVQRIQGLEAQVRELSKQVPATRFESSSPEVSFFGGRGNDGTQKVDVATKEEGVEGDVEEERSTEVSGSASVVAELAFLRHEIATLRGGMERVQRSNDQLPPYST